MLSIRRRIPNNCSKNYEKTYNNKYNITTLYYCFLKIKLGKRIRASISQFSISNLIPPPKKLPPINRKEGQAKASRAFKEGKNSNCQKKKRKKENLSKPLLAISAATKSSNVEYRARARYLTAMSLFPRVNPTSSLNMKIRVAPRYHLML